VTVGAAPSAALADPEAAAVAAALTEAGVAVVSRTTIDDDDGALERALAPDDGLTVVLAGSGGSAGDIVRRVLARAAGRHLVLSERFLAALEECYRRLDRPVPRRAERLALLPQGAVVWLTDEGEPGWALEAGARAFAVLVRDGGLQAALGQYLVPFARARFAGRGVVLVRTLRTAGVTPAEVEERLADWLRGRGHGQPPS
jgi:nicotinamide-nucleotide amidase